jgi:hypothetical protein
MAQVVELKTGNPKVQGSHLTPQRFEIVCFWAWFTFNIKLFYLLLRNVMVKMVEQLVTKFKVEGSTPTTLFEIFSFFHSHIHNI